MYVSEGLMWRADSHAWVCGNGITCRPGDIRRVARACMGRKKRSCVTGRGQFSAKHGLVLAQY